MRQCGIIGKARQATNKNVIRRMHFECWINKVTDTHLEYILSFAFPQQHRLCEWASMLLL